MKTNSLIAGMMLAALAAPGAAASETRDAKACQAMQATIVPRQTEIADISAVRDASAELAETTGAAWEDAEIHRLISKAHADAADRDKAAYDAARAKLARDEMALQDAVRQFNADVAMFNTRCSTKG